MDLFKWRKEVISEVGPRSVTRHVLLTLSIHMDREGDKCFPTTKTLARETGLSERTVCTHLKIAEVAGWIKKTNRGTGKGWRRSYYKATLPQGISRKMAEDGTESVSAASFLGAERGSTRKCDGAEPHDSMVLKEVQSSSSYTSPNKRIIYNPDSDAFKLSTRLKVKILEHHPKFKIPDVQKWAKHIDLAMRRDSRTKEELEAVIDWCQADAFWKTKILSTEKLRMHFDKLWLQMNGEKQNGPNGQLHGNKDGRRSLSIGTRSEKYKNIGRVINCGE